MVRLVTDAAAYFNDISEEIRLFFGFVEITAEGRGDIELEIKLDTTARRVFARLMPNGLTTEIELPTDEGDSLERKRQEKRAVKLAAYRLLKQAMDTDTPWGSLTGIRPTKLFRELTERSGGVDAAEKLFLETFDVSAQKTALAREICAVQKPYIDSAEDKLLDVYVGIPYCKSRCLYCSFGSELAKRDGSLEDYLETLLVDIDESAKLSRRHGFSPRALYVGGGTPTVLSAEQLYRLLTFTLDRYGSFCELTVEAGRPDTITREKLELIKRAGVGRISVNPQSMNDETLKRVGRLHSAKETELCYHMARDVGFDSINMDLIAGLPGEKLQDFTRTLQAIEALAPDNLTIHTLAIKRSSRLKEKLDSYPLPTAEEVEEMLRLGAKSAANMGLHPYYMYRQKYMQGNLENVGYAGEGKDCVYNIDMMEETLSIMAQGAHGMTKRVYGCGQRVERIPNPKDVPTYRAKLSRLIEVKNTLFSD